MKISLKKYGLFAIMLFAGCSESDLNKVNPNGGTTLSYYSNADELTKGVNAIYAKTQSVQLAAREWFFINDLRSDDVATGGGQLEAARNQVLTGVHLPPNQVVTDVWTGLYRVVHRANSTIEGSANTKNIDDALKARLVAEARFLRAWTYSELVQLWGGVPLYKKTIQKLSDSQPRSTTADVLQFVIDELGAIQNDLLVSYAATDKGRATRGAALALMGKMQMVKGDYAGAKASFDKVVALGVYSLMPNYSDNFLEETAFNSESLFEIGFGNDSFNWDGDGNTTGGNGEGNTRTQEYSAIGWRNLIPSNVLINDYERVADGFPKDDPRFAANFYRIGDMYNNNATALADASVQGNLSNFHGSQQKVSWKKYTSMYKNNATFYTGPMNMRLIRYAEVLLDLAECENELGNGVVAIGYLNQIRNRSSVAMPNYPIAGKYPTSTKGEIFTAIVHEKRIELAGEQIRNKDILRWRKQGKLSSEPIPYFQANKHELLPIPQVEFSTNSSLKAADQNPGY